LPSLLIRGHALGQIGQEASALANFQRAVAVDPNSVDAWTSLCWYRILTNAVADARAACEKARTIDPGSMAATVNLGHTYLLQGDRHSAWLWYEKSVPPIDDESALQDGPLADFALFVRRSWLRTCTIIGCQSAR